MGGRGASAGETKFREIEARYNRVNEQYQKYAKVLNYSNKTEYRDMFDKMKKARDELRETYNRYLQQRENKKRRRNVPF